MLRTVRRLLAELTKAMQKLSPTRRLAVSVPGARAFRRDRHHGEDGGGVQAERHHHAQDGRGAGGAEDSDRGEKQAALHQLADAFEGEVMGVVRSVAAAAARLQENAI